MAVSRRSARIAQQLLNDSDLSVAKINVRWAQPEQFTLAQPKKASDENQST